MTKLTSLLILFSLISCQEQSNVLEIKPIKSKLIIGKKDDRTEVLDNSDSIIYQRGLITMGLHDSDDSFICNATMIHPRFALTAAHCIYSDKKKSMYDKIVFRPGIFKGNKGLQGKLVKNIWIHSDYFSEFIEPKKPKDDFFARHISSDIALIEFEAAYEDDRVSPMKVVAIDMKKDQALNTGVIIAHHGDKGPKRLFIQEECEVSLAIRREDFFVSTCDFTKGASGSGQLVETEKGHVLIGVVSSFSEKENNITPVTEDMIFEFKDIFENNDLKETSTFTKKELEMRKESYSVTNECDEDIKFYTSVTREFPKESSITVLKPGETGEIIEMLPGKFFVHIRLAKREAQFKGDEEVSIPELGEVSAFIFNSMSSKHLDFSCN